MPEITKPEIIDDRINKIRTIMKKNAVDCYVIGTGDYHMSEYAGAFFGEREYASGFTGSAGTLAITMKDAALFTDGRYFVQAQLQIYNTQIKLMKMGCIGVPALEEYCGDLLPEGGCIGFDGRTVQAEEGLRLKSKAEEKHGTVNFSFNAVEAIWLERPPFPDSKAYELKLCYCGETRQDKLNRLRNKIRLMGADAHIISTLDDICWLTNLRASDVYCNPVMMSYFYITEKEAILYTNRDRLINGDDYRILEALEKDEIEVRPYSRVYEDLQSIKNISLLIDMKRVNMKLYSCVDNSVKIIKTENPTVLMKAVKNNTEINNLKAINALDGLCVTRFMYWIKQEMKQNTQKITEYDAAEYLDNLRSKVEGYLELSFPTICAYNENAAQLHYSATKDSCARLQPKGMLLVDSGGQYYKGTTDVTRTIALGNVTKDMKKHYTLVLKGLLNLSNARFLKGCTGYNLDILARGPLWNEELDYRCGTGHGIGYLLNVHEAPNGFRWKHIPGRNDLCVLEQGMVTSNEPGVYIDGQYGIRIENMMVCVEDIQNEYGQFMKFDTLTAVPFDRDLIDTDLLDKEDINRINKYHKFVWNTLSPLLKGEELDFLREYTSDF